VCARSLFVVLILSVVAPAGSPLAGEDPGPAGARSRSSPGPAALALPLPSAEELRALVVRANGLNPERFRALARRAGNAAWLPVLEIRVDRNLEDDRSSSRSRSLSVSSTGVYLGPDDESWALATDDDWRFRVRAVWELDRLVYDRGELAALQREIDALDKRTRLVDQAFKTFFEWRRLRRARQLAPPSDAAGRAAQALKLEQLHARLDALTDGGFSRRLRATSGGSP